MIRILFHACSCRSAAFTHLPDELHNFGRDSKNHVLGVHRLFLSLRPSRKACVGSDFSLLECSVNHVVDIVRI